MGGWKSAIELVPKIGKVMGKAFGEGGTKAVEQVAKISKAEMKQAKDLRKAEGAIKSIGSPKINVSGVDISRFSYKNGKFWDLKHANTSYSRKEFAQLQSHYSNLFKGGNKVDIRHGKEPYQNQILLLSSILSTMSQKL